ncbi:MAG: glycosyltransferase [Kiritimatiellia bacterium]
MSPETVTGKKSSSVAENLRPLLFETAWEVCQKIGGIYTVIRSKVPEVMSTWGQRYCLLGPYNPEVSPLEFEEMELDGPIAPVVKKMREKGFAVHTGYWLVTGRPRVILFEYKQFEEQLPEIRKMFLDNHQIPVAPEDSLTNEVAMFAWVLISFFTMLNDLKSLKNPVIAHFHEWMSAMAIPELRRRSNRAGIVFTTHATMLGRYLAMNNPEFYTNMTGVDWQAQAAHFNIMGPVVIERAAAHGAHVFTTVSKVTGRECEALLGRAPDVLLPNGLNLRRFVAMHEFQNLHRSYKEKIHQFVMAHFFPSYTFDLDNTLYFFTAGRYEYRNKGFDMTLEAMARLNYRIKLSGLNRTIVFFLITRQAYKSATAEVFRRQAMLEEMRGACESIKDSLGNKLLIAAAKGHIPEYETLVDETSRMRLRRIMHAWPSSALPPFVTHELVSDDEVMQKIRACKLINRPDDPVKVIYYPEFVSTSDGLIGIDYDNFVRGCHLGIFPSYYEPWGYTPLECVACGVPAVTSDLSGFGSYLNRCMPDWAERGLYVAPRSEKSEDEATNDLTNWLYDFAQLDRRERIALRNKVERSSDDFDWHNLGKNYTEAYEMVCRRAGF